MASFFQATVNADATSARRALAAAEWQTGWVGRQHEQVAGLCRYPTFYATGTSYTWNGTLTTNGAALPVTNGAALPVTNGSALPVTNGWATYSGNLVAYNANFYEHEQRLTAEVIVPADEFDSHPDPDALLGEYMDRLRAQLEEAVGVTIARDAVWENWLSDAVASTGDVRIQVEWTPRQLTIEAWDAWQNLPKLRRVRDSRGRVTEVTEEEFRQREQAAARQRLVSANRHRSSELRRKIAVRRAEELLIAHLDEEQAREWAEKRHFHIHTADGERTYQIRHGRAGNITLVKGAVPNRPHVKRFCFHEYHPTDNVPTADNVLAQKLFIEANEEQFLAIANPA